MDAALAIAVGSTSQIGLLITPVLLFLSYLIAPTPMNLLFSTFEVMALGLACADDCVHRARRRDALDGGSPDARGVRDPGAVGSTFFLEHDGLRPTRGPVDRANQPADLSRGSGRRAAR